MLCKIWARPRCLFVCLFFYGPIVEVNKLVFEGWLDTKPCSDKDLMVRSPSNWKMDYWYKI